MFIFSLPNSSAGFGGIGPDLIISKFLILVLKIISFLSDFSDRYVDNPISLSFAKDKNNFGFLMSAPINKVFFPDIAYIVAKFFAQNVLPSPLIEDVNNIVLPLLSLGIINSIFDLIFLNDSAILDFGFSFTIKSNPLLLDEINPK